MPKINLNGFTDDEFMEEHLRYESHLKQQAKHIQQKDMTYLHFENPSRAFKQFITKGKKHGRHDK